MVVITGCVWQNVYASSNEHFSESYKQQYKAQRGKRKIIQFIVLTSQLATMGVTIVGGI